MNSRKRAHQFWIKDGTICKMEAILKNCPEKLTWIQLGWRIDIFLSVITVGLLRWTEFLQVWPYSLIFPTAHMTMMLFPDSRMRLKLCIYTELSESKCKWVSLNRVVTGAFPEEQNTLFMVYLLKQLCNLFSFFKRYFSFGTQIIENRSSLLLTFCWNPSFNQNKKHFQSVSLTFSSFQINVCAWHVNKTKQAAVSTHFYFLWDVYKWWKREVKEITYFLVLCSNTVTEELIEHKLAHFISYLSLFPLQMCKTYFQFGPDGFQLYLSIKWVQQSDHSVNEPDHKLPDCPTACVSWSVRQIIL